MTHRSRNLAVVLGALTVGACSVYGPGDLPSASGSGGTLNGGSGGIGGHVNWGGAGLGTGGNDGSGGLVEEGGGATETGGASGAGGKTSGNGGAPTTGGRASGGSNSEGGSTTSTGGVVTAAGGVTATGGKASGGSASGGAAPVVPPELIDDMEDTDGRIYVQEDSLGQRRDGYWYTGADSTSTVDPAQGTDIAMTELSVADKAVRTGSLYAFHFSGKGGPASTTAWGALGGFDLKQTTSGTKHPYDAHLYKGIRFWAKAVGSGTTTISVRLPIRDTTLNADGAACGSKCEDHWYKKQALTSSWVLYDVVWPSSATVLNGFLQSGWGFPTNFDPKTLVGVQFVIAPASSGDIWIDDVSFIPGP